MRKLIDTEKLQITSKFGWRPGFNWPHGGCDFRAWENYYDNQKPFLLTELSLFIAVVDHGKWGTYVEFKPLETEAEGYTKIVYGHCRPAQDYIPGMTYNTGEIVGYAMQTPYMVKNKYYKHLHFETHINNKKRDPLKYLDIIGVEYYE